MNERLRTLLVVMLVTGIIISSCKEKKSEHEAEKISAERSDEQENIKDFERCKTVFFDIDGGPVEDPELWNPFMPGRRLVHGLHQVLMEPLFILNYETNEIEPWLGKSMKPNESFDIWTLVLRQGIKWSDGEDFNTDDVVFTLNMLLENVPEYTYIYTDDLKNSIESVEKVDDLVLKIYLKDPNVRFQLDFWSVKIWTTPGIVPEHIWRDKDPMNFKNYDPSKGWPVFTGPYRLKSISNTKFVYERDDKWWGAKSGWKELPEPERLVWKWYGSEEERMSAMANNELDNVLDISLGNLLDIKAQNPNIITHYSDLPYAWVPDPCARNLELNNTVPPWNDKKMRWALNFAINRDEMVAFAYNGTTIASRHFFPTYSPLNHYVDLLEEAGFYVKYPLMEFNPEKSRKIIESKGYKLNENGFFEKNGKELSLSITTHLGFVEKQRLAKVIVNQLKGVGINASVQNEDAATWYKNFYYGDYEARIGWQACGSVTEPWASMDTFNSRWLKPVGERTGENQNPWRWSGKAAESYSNKVDKIRLLPIADPMIDELFVKAMEIWLDELPIIPIVQARKIMPFNTTYWTGWPTAKNNYIHPPTWWQSTHAIIHNLESTQQ